jgi:hypothetical protein
VKAAQIKIATSVLGAAITGGGTILAGPASVFAWAVLGTGSALVSYNLSSAMAELNAAWERYFDCIAGNLLSVENQSQFIEGCPPILDPQPVDFTVLAQVNTSGSKDIIFGARDIISGIMLGNYIYSGDFGAGISSVTNNPGGSGFRLQPGQRITVSIVYECPSVPKIITGSFTVASNATVKSKSASVTIKCLNASPTLVGPTPDPLEFKAPVGQTASGTITFSNMGMADLNVWIQNPTIVVPKGETRNYTRSYLCSTTVGAETYAGIMNVSHNDPARPSPYPLPFRYACTGVNRQAVPYLTHGNEPGGVYVDGYSGTTYIVKNDAITSVLWTTNIAFTGVVRSQRITCSAQLANPSTTQAIVNLRNQVTACVRTGVRALYADAVVAAQAIVDDPVQREAKLGWARYVVGLRVKDQLDTTNTISGIGDLVIK